jgi:branched-chain amino acid transport system substrate-binding protein
MSIHRAGALRAGLAAFVCAASAALLTSCATSNDVVVRIAHVGPLTGQIAHLGRDNENGSRLAIEDLNARGVTIGGRRAIFELVAEDDAADPRAAVAAAQRIVDQHVAGVVGHLNSGTTIPASRIYADAGIPQISPSATNPWYTRQGFPTAFRVIADDHALGDYLGRHALNTLHAQRIVVIDDHTNYGRVMADAFTQRVRRSPGVVVQSRTWATTPEELPALVEAIDTFHADLVFYGGMDGDVAKILRAMADAGLHTHVLGGDGICTSGLPHLAGGVIQSGQVECGEGGGFDAAHERAISDFRERYRKRFGVDVQIYAPYTYDATMVLVDAMVRAQSAEPARYLPFLAQTHHAGITGEIAFDSKGDLSDGVLTMYTYRGSMRYRTGTVMTQGSDAGAADGMPLVGASRP